LQQLVSASSPNAEIATLKIDRGNPAAALGIARTHHVDAIPAGLSFDDDLISVFVSRAFARANVSVEEPSDTSRDISKGWTESLAFAAFALPYLAGNDLNPICSVGWIATADDGIANRGERLGQCALNGAQLRSCWQRDENESGGNERAALSGTRPSQVMTDDSVDDHATSGHQRCRLPRGDEAKNTATRASCQPNGFGRCDHVTPGS
jgi:hypothetical protein